MHKDGRAVVREMKVQVNEVECISSAVYAYHQLTYTAGARCWYPQTQAVIVGRPRGGSLEVKFFLYFENKSRPHD